VEDGKIVAIHVEDGGSMYAAEEIAVEGSGAGVEILPVFGADGDLISNTFDTSEAERRRNREYASNHYFKSSDPIIPNFIFR
jgi:hypothetical protein